MTRRIVPVATQVLSLLPFVQTLTGRAPSAKLERNDFKWNRSAQAALEAAAKVAQPPPGEGLNKNLDHYVSTRNHNDLKRNPKKWMPLFGKIARPHKNLEPFGGSAKPTDALIAAAGLINTPYARRVAPGLSGLISVGLAVVAMAGFVRNIQRRKTTQISGRRR